MPHNAFNQVVVTELVDVEFDVGAPEETIMRLLVRSRVGNQLAVEFSFSDWETIHGALVAALKQFPGGRLVR